MGSPCMLLEAALIDVDESNQLQRGQEDNLIKREE